LDSKSTSVGLQPVSSGRGVQEVQVWSAADALLKDGLRPTIERVRQRIGSGSPNTVSPMLERWFATLGKRLEGPSAIPVGGGSSHLPLALVTAAQQVWSAALHEAEQAQVQASEAARQEFMLERDALMRRADELQQRELAFDQARIQLDEALLASRQAVSAMEAQLHRQQQESARHLHDQEAEARRLRKALDDALGSKEALRENSAMELAARRRAYEEAEERHVVHERRLLSEVDRERLATRQANLELTREQKARTSDREAFRTLQESAEDALRAEQAARRADALVSAESIQTLQLELATQRERAAGTERRAAELAAQLLRQRDDRKASQKDGVRASRARPKD
jgi:hypothetical protein